MESVQFISAVIIRSADAPKLAAFYSSAFGIPLEASDHDPETPHFECELGDVHFAIHPVEQSDRAREEEGKTGRIKLAFAVSNLDEVLNKLKVAGVVPLYEPVDRGFAKMTAVLDPDGNLVELTELSARWLKYLGSRTPLQRDIVTNALERH